MQQGVTGGHVRGWDRLQAAHRYRGRTWLAVGVHTGKGETEARASGKDMGTGDMSEAI